MAQRAAPDLLAASEPSEPPELVALPLTRIVLIGRLLAGLVAAAAGLAAHGLGTGSLERFGVPFAVLAGITLAEFLVLPRLGPGRPRLAFLAGDAVIALAILVVGIGDPAAALFPIGTAALSGLLLGAAAVPIWIGLAVQASVTCWALIAGHTVGTPMQILLLSAPILCVCAGMAALAASDARIQRQEQRREQTGPPVPAGPRPRLWPDAPPASRVLVLGILIAVAALAVPFLPPVLVGRTAPDSTAISALMPPPAPPAGPTQVSVPAISVPTTPASTRAPKHPSAPQPTSHPASPTTHPAAQPAPARKTQPPKPKPTFAPRTIAATDAANTRVGVEPQDCPTCASGSRISYLADERSLTVPVNGVAVAGARRLTIVYESGDHARDLYVSVNGGILQRLVDLPKTTDWTIPGTTALSITLKKGANTLVFSNPVGPAPDLDQFRIR